MHYAVLSLPSSESDNSVSIVEMFVARRVYRKFSNAFLNGSTRSDAWPRRKANIHAHGILARLSINEFRLANTAQYP